MPARSGPGRGADMKHVFFRDDDLGWEHERFVRMLDLFTRHEFKLNAAAIPTEAAALRAAGRLNPGALPLLLEVHAHGFSHANHEADGKKSEFGRSRTSMAVVADLAAAHAVCSEVFGPAYYPAFVPPWNRLDEAWAPLVRAAGFEVLSRDGTPRASVPGLLELNVSVDLHTDKRRPGAGLADWLEALDRSPDGPVGIMLHHAKMAEADFGRLEAFLAELRARGTASSFFSELRAASEEKG